MCTNMLDQVINRLAEIFDLGLWSDWFAELDRTFVFLLLLPFVVAVVGLWAGYRERDAEQQRRDENVTDRPRRRTHGSRVGGHRYNQ